MPQNFSENPKLGIWVNTQRDLKKKGKLNDEKKALMNQIGFKWTLKVKSGVAVDADH